jgi:chromosomal replication initiation ATPase DnaA
MTDSEIPLVHQHPAAPRVQNLVTQVASSYGERKENILSATRRPSEARQVAIYLARRVAGLELKAIAKQFGLSYTGVSRRVSAVDRRTDETRHHKFQAVTILKVAGTFALVDVRHGKTSCLRKDAVRRRHGCIRP